MHELAIAENIITAVLKKQQAERLRRITTIGLRIGELTDIVPDALEFGFETATTDTPLAGTRLDIERVPISGTCLTCGKEITVADFRFSCAYCLSSNLDITTGLELDIAWLEVEDESAADVMTSSADGCEEIK